MTATTETAAPSHAQQAFSTILDPHDHTLNPDRYKDGTWDIGALRHVASQLAGTDAWVVLDKMTGHMSLVEIVGIGYVPSRQSPGLCVRFHYTENGKPGSQVTNYSVWQVGAIVPVDPARHWAKWRITDSLRNEQSAAIDACRAAHPEANYGKWTARSTECAGDVVVTYEPQRDGAGERFYEIVRLPV